jgi:NADPH:quinone reductase-like Zn-dependent oxidoreductase
MKGRILAELEANVWPKIEVGLIRPVLYKTLPMSEAEAAHSILSRNENTGKVVLAIKRETRTAMKAG